MNVGVYYMSLNPDKKNTKTNNLNARAGKMHVKFMIHLHT